MWDAERRSVTASGNVKIISEGRHLSGDTLSLNLDTESGELLPVRGEYHNIFLEAERIEILPDRISAHDAKITTCDQHRPHYQIAARKVDIYLLRADRQPTPERLEARGAGLIFHGRRLLSLPPLRMSLKEGEESERSLPLPYPGYSGPDGPFIAYRWSDPRPENKFNLDLECRATSRRGTRAAAYARYYLENGDLLQLTLSRREDLSDRYIGPRGVNTDLEEVLVSRQPELSLRTAPRTVTPALRWDSQVSIGHYRERPTGVSADRAAITGQVHLGPFPLERRLSLMAATAYRFSYYGDGTDSGVFYNRLTLTMSPSQSSDFSISLVTRERSGSTPFLFDDVDLSRELTGETRFALGNRWQVKLLDRYDLQQNRTRDAGIELRYRAHCLDYTVGWRENRDLFQFGVSVVMPPGG
ncbi:MAG: hypothetical protein GTN69_04475 [Armatimonadetes bacterium]|nr:hypothetical protein [Armatimonadota bacterium]NIO75140.1 hypothetical protein [Armatimonadota bacterium]NIO95764.1 hypothetical protein [Armatimonadota bacterium]